MTTSRAAAAVGGMPRWRDLPHLAGIVARAYGAAPARARIVGAAWRATAGSFWLLLLAAARARGRVRATRHAVVIMDAPAVLTGREAGLLAAVVAAMLLGVGACEGVLVALVTAVGVGGGWVQWASPALLVSLLIVESAPAGLRAARGWGRTASVAREVRASGRSAATAGMLAAWPHGHGHARELIRTLTAQADQTGLDIVVDAATPELADTYLRYGWQPCSARDPLLLLRTASRWESAADSTRK